MAVLLYHKFNKFHSYGQLPKASEIIYRWDNTTDLLPFIFDAAVEVTIILVNNNKIVAIGQQNCSRNNMNKTHESTFAVPYLRLLLRVFSAEW